MEQILSLAKTGTGEAQPVLSCIFTVSSLSTEPRSLNSARGKVWTGAVGAALGVVLGAAGVSFYLRTRRGKEVAGEGGTKQGGGRRVLRGGGYNLPPTAAQDFSSSWSLLGPF